MYIVYIPYFGFSHYILRGVFCCCLKRWPGDSPAQGQIEIQKAFNVIAWTCSCLQHHQWYYILIHLILCAIVVFYLHSIQTPVSRFLQILFANIMGAGSRINIVVLHLFYGMLLNMHNVTSFVALTKLPLESWYDWPFTSHRKLWM